MKSLFIYLFIDLFAFLMPLKCLGEEVISLGEAQSKAMNVAFENFRNHENWHLFNIMIIDGVEDVQISFYCKSSSEETRGGGEKQIIYMISKTNFRIKNINKSRSK